MSRALRRFLLPSFDPLAAQRLRLSRHIEAGSSVLDAGCGDGAMALRLARRGCRVVAVSHDAAQIARLSAKAPDGVAFRVHDLSQGGPVEGRFDAVLCLDVLEHILDDRTALANAVAPLRRGGRLLVTVPNRLAPPLWGDRLSAAEDGGHVRPGYTRDELGALLRGAGLTPVHWSSFGGFFTRKAASLNRRLERRPGRFWLLPRFLGLVLLRPLCRLDPLLPGRRCELFVLATRA
ncbi:MAG TPA: class I SAM-dependent methyltransferase [Planctomycetota bacterium]|nr:class I SAM-dependent methyltransferase [Planctomycetota bacterium]HRR80719.1 class I SAM-dependent methyltransferase [Planctomycetota bacterium]HRT96799.1 class I SAM-dependent methyltransferase [Planctomycetota bacterium]